MSNSRDPMKPCPFCGGEAELFGNYNSKSDCWFVTVKCKTCNAQGSSVHHSQGWNDYTDEEFFNHSACNRAVNKWNRRV